MGNKEILDYVMNSPGNTNPSVLKGLLGNTADGGSSGGVFMVEEEYDETTNTVTLKATWQEIYDAFNSGKLVATYYTEKDELRPSNILNNIRFVVCIDRVNEGCSVVVFGFSDGSVISDTFACSAPDERPHTGDNSGGSGGGASL